MRNLDHPGRALVALLPSIRKLYLSSEILDMLPDSETWPSLILVAFPATALEDGERLPALENNRLLPCVCGSHVLSGKGEDVGSIQLSKMSDQS